MNQTSQTIYISNQAHLVHEPSSNELIPEASFKLFSHWFGSLPTLTNRLSN